MTYEYDFSVSEWQNQSVGRFGGSNSHLCPGSLVRFVESTVEEILGGPRVGIIPHTTANFHFICTDFTVTFPGKKGAARDPHPGEGLSP